MGQPETEGVSLPWVAWGLGCASKKGTNPMQAAPIDTTDAIPIEVNARWPLAKTKVAPENMREGGRKAEDDLTGMCDSIANPRVGLLQNLVGYVDGDIFYVTCGRRRRSALNRLKKDKRLPADIAANGVPVTIKDKASALEASLVENTQRQAPTPAQELRAYKGLADKGLDARAIAAVCGVPESNVVRLLKLSRVPAVVFEAFEREEVDLDVLKSFTLTDDTARQEEVWSLLMETQKWVRAYEVRKLLTDGTIGGRDSDALFVGREAYLAAGGTFIQDLFSNNNSEVWTDAALVQQLKHEKLARLVETVQSEGWAAVEVAPNTYNFAGVLERAYPDMRDPTEAEAARRDELQALIIDPETCPYAKAEAMSERHALEEARRLWTDEDRASGKVFIVLRNGGHVEVMRGYFRPAKADGSASDSKAPPPPFGHAGHERMTRVATTAVRNAVALDPLAAFDADLAHKAWVLLRHGRGHQDYAMPAYVTGSEPAEGTSVKGDREYEDLFAAWDERLPHTYLEFFPAVVALTMDEKMQLNALCVAASLNAVSNRQDFHRKKAWAQLGLIAGRAGVVMSEAWTPDGEFLKGAKKASLLGAIRDMEGDVDAHAKDKVGALIEVVGRMAAKHRWVPPLLANLTEPVLEEGGNRAALAAAMGPQDDDDAEFGQDGGEG